jgi:hypothetical protein
VKLNEKMKSEFEAEKVARTSANDDYNNWKTQREIRLNTKKESNR